MIKRLLPSLAAAFLFAFAASSADASVTGTRVHLKALPSYVDRVFVPVVPQSENTLAIEALTFDQVIEAPQGFDVRTERGAIVVKPAAGERAGYARVRAAGRELTLTLVN